MNLETQKVPKENDIYLSPQGREIKIVGLSSKGVFYIFGKEPIYEARFVSNQTFNKYKFVEPETFVWKCTHFSGFTAIVFTQPKENCYKNVVKYKLVEVDDES